MKKLYKLDLNNYKCFQNSQMSFKDITIIVGKNNAGKSTIIEALRLVSWAGKKSKITNAYTIAPLNFGFGLSKKGIKLNVEKLRIDLRGSGYFYSNAPSVIKATFDDKSKIEINIKEGIVFAMFYDSDENMIKGKAKAMKLAFDSIAILPQIGLIKENEKLLNDDTVASDRDTYLSSRHFRNELKLYQKEFFHSFKKLAEKSWHGLEIDDICYNPNESSNINLYVKDNRFTAEIGLMGSGLQMWLQVIWFICRTEKQTTVILDEPDIYIHPDLQRKLLHILKSRFPQVIIATHSVEIISEVEPKSIVTVDKKSRYMKYANSYNAVQTIIDNIGSVHNLSLLRISNSRKCIFVEGKDLKILSKFYDILYPGDYNPISSLPSVSLGGFSNLKEAFGSSKLFYEETEGIINTFCILDKDYYAQEFLEDKLRQAKENNLCLYIWSKKEIENYILIPAALFRITQRSQRDYDIFLKNFSILIEDFKDQVQDQISAKIIDYNKAQGLDTSSSLQIARGIIKEKWTTIESKLSLVSGKEMISKINGWMKEQYNKSCSMDKIIKNIRSDEVDDEIAHVINELIK